MEVSVTDDQLSQALNDLALDSACIAESKGFWSIPEIGELGLIPTKLALIHSEVSEALAEHRAAINLDPPEDDADCAEIPLYDLDAALQGYALVDEADYDFLTLWSWSKNQEGYVIRGPGYGRLMHRELLGLTSEDSDVVDHINGNPLDNRRSNLRAITTAQNLQNRKSVVGSSSVHRGVSWNAQKEQWKANAMVEGRRYHLGWFDSEREAANTVERFRRDNVPFSREAEQARRLREGHFTEEIADIVIRTLDLCGYYRLDIGEAVVNKMKVNRERPPKHGKRY